MKKQNESGKIAYVWIANNTLHWLFKSPYWTEWQMTTEPCDYYSLRGTDLLKQVVKAAREDGWETHYTSCPEKNRDLLIALLKWKVKGGPQSRRIVEPY
jgi:hypothetical protein